VNSFENKTPVLEAVDFFLQIIDTLNLITYVFKKTYWPLFWEALPFFSFAGFFMAW